MTTETRFAPRAAVVTRARTTDVVISRAFVSSPRPVRSDDVIANRHIFFFVTSLFQLGRSYLRDRPRRRVREPGFRAHVPARPRCQIIARIDHAIACPVASRGCRRRRGATRGGRVPFVLPAFARRGSRLAVRAAAVPRAVRSRARRRRGTRGARAVCPPRRPPRGRGRFRASVQRSLRGASAGDVERLGVGRSRGMEVSGDDGGDRRRRVILLRARAVATAGLGQGWPFRRQSQPRGAF